MIFKANMCRRIYVFPLIILICFQPYNYELRMKLQGESISYNELQYEVLVALKLVQIFVTDKDGNPVTDLCKSDFEIKDNRKSVKITDFEKHILSLPKENSMGVTRSRKPGNTYIQSPRLARKFLLFFDFAFNEMKGILRAKKAALHFIDSQVHPDDEIGIMSYDVFKGLTLHEYFTKEHNKIREAIENESNSR